MSFLTRDVRARSTFRLRGAPIRASNFPERLIASISASRSDA
jgi:hypothetical protein